jgi:hypothetical protein
MDGRERAPLDGELAIIKGPLKKVDEAFQGCFAAAGRRIRASGRRADTRKCRRSTMRVSPDGIHGAVPSGISLVRLGIGLPPSVQGMLGRVRDGARRRRMDSAFLHELVEFAPLS